MTIAPLLLALAGCATPEHRIKQHPEMFEAFPPEVQQQVRQGQIDLGFTPDMVFIALGRPDREYIRRTDQGNSTVWSYVTTERYSDRQRVPTRARVRDSDGRFRTVHGSDYVRVRMEREVERMRVEFVDGRVAAIEVLNE